MPFSAKSTIPLYMNWPARIVFPVPGPPTTSTTRLCGNPPLTSSSKPGIPVLTTFSNNENSPDSVALLSIIMIFS